MGRGLDGLLDRLSMSYYQMVSNRANALDDYDDHGIRYRRHDDPPNYVFLDADRGYLAGTAFDVTPDTFAREEDRRAADPFTHAPLRKTKTGGKTTWEVIAPPPGLQCSMRLGAVEKMY